MDDYFDYWTVQDKSVMDEVLHHGYFPTLEKSQFLKQFTSEEAKNKLLRLYNVITTGVCVANDIPVTDLSSVVFAYAKLDTKTHNLKPIESYDKFYKFVQKNSEILKTCWPMLARNDNAIIMHLRFPKTFKPVSIDLNGWAFCMPPTFDFGDTVNIRKEILMRMLKGENQYTEILGPIEDDVIQCHLPYIQKENFVGVYPMFNLSGGTTSTEKLTDYYNFVHVVTQYGGIEESEFTHKTMDEASLVNDEPEDKELRWIYIARDAREKISETRKIHNGFLMDDEQIPTYEEMFELNQKMKEDELWEKISAEADADYEAWARIESMGDEDE